MSARGTTMTGSFERRGPASTRVPNAARWAVKRSKRAKCTVLLARAVLPSPRAEHQTKIPAVLRAQ